MMNNNKSSQAFHEGYAFRFLGGKNIIVNDSLAARWPISDWKQIPPRETRYPLGNTLEWDRGRDALTGMIDVKIPTAATAEFRTTSNHHYRRR